MVNFSGQDHQASCYFSSQRQKIKFFLKPQKSFCQYLSRLKGMARDCKKFKKLKNKRPKLLKTKNIFTTPWFGVQKLTFKTRNKNINPYYRIKGNNGVFILALTVKNEFVLVRQFRPAIGTWTYEMPAGGVEKLQTSLAAARRELWEETGYVASRWLPLGSGRMMMDRFSGKMTGWLALGVEKIKSSKKAKKHLPVKKINIFKFSGWVS